MSSGCTTNPPPVAVRASRLTARIHPSGFGLAHDTYNGMGTGSDGKIYYVLSSEPYETGAQVYSYDPATTQSKHLGDLTEACGEKGKKTIVQGKSHVQFVESNGNLYFATHIAERGSGVFHSVLPSGPETRVNCKRRSSPPATPPTYFKNED